MKRRPVSWQSLVQYADILGCEPSWLARGEGAAPPAAAPMAKAKRLASPNCELPVLR